MRSVHIAERILALVTTPDRAASTVGDLTEQSATRGMPWFWSGLFRTAASLLWRDVAENPARVTGLAFLCLGVGIGLDLLFACLTGIAFSGVALSSGHPLHVESLGWRIWFATPMLVCPLFIGWMLARRAPGREMAACLVFAVLVSIYNLVPMLGDNGGFSNPLCILLVLAGAAWGRSRRLAATRRHAL